MCSTYLDLFYRDKQTGCGIKKYICYWGSLRKPSNCISSIILMKGFSVPCLQLAFANTKFMSCYIDPIATFFHLL